MGADSASWIDPATRAMERTATAEVVSVKTVDRAWRHPGRRYGRGGGGADGRSGHVRRAALRGLPARGVLQLLQHKRADRALLAAGSAAGFLGPSPALALAHSWAIATGPYWPR